MNNASALHNKFNIIYIRKLIKDPTSCLFDNPKKQSNNNISKLTVIKAIKAL